MARYFPIFIDLRGKPCLVVGAGEIGASKAAQLIKYGASVTVVAPEVHPDVDQWAKDGSIRLLRRSFQEADVEGMTLVVGSTSSTEVNTTVFEAASRRGILANIVDVPDLCSFTYGAIVERGDLQIVVSTSGRSPAYAARLRRELEDSYGEEYGIYLDILGQVRHQVQQTVDDLKHRKLIYRRVFEMDLLPLLREGRAEEARRLALQCISQSLD